MCAVGAWGVVFWLRSDRPGWAAFFGGTTLLFNPLLPVRLARDAWAPIDVFVAIAFVVSIGFWIARYRVVVNAEHADDYAAKHPLETRRTRSLRGT